MYSLDSLKDTIEQLFRDGIGENGYDADEVDALLGGIDYPSLLQAARHNMKTVFAYSVEERQSVSPGYRGADLFGQQAVRLYDTFGEYTWGPVVMGRTHELWLLEDMRIAVVVCVTVSFNGGACETEYREIRESGPWDCGMCLNLEVLADGLDELCVPVYEGRQPFYEL